MRWNRRRRHHWPKLRSLKEGDIVWVERYPHNEPVLLVQRIHHKKVIPPRSAYASERTVYWCEGVFLSLLTGKLETKKLSNAMTNGEVTRAPRPLKPVNEEDEDDDNDEVG